MLNTLVVILTKNNKSSLERLLDSLDNVDKTFDTLIIDTYSFDGTLETARRRVKNVVSVSVDQFNHGGTREMAFQLNDRYNYYIYLTQDVVLANQDTISNILKAFQNPQVGAVCGRQLPHADANLFASHARFFNYPETSRIKSLEDADKLQLKTAFLSNSFAAYRADALRDVGGFPNHVIFGEDMYVAARMLQKKWKIGYAADATCLHSHNYTIKEEFKRYFDNGVFHARDSWIRKMLGGAGGEGISYVCSELRFLGWRNLNLWPSSLLRNALKYLGFKMGLYEKHFPVSIKKKLSMNSKFWETA